MTFTIFKNLDEQDREMVIACHGVHIATRIDKEYNYFLFQVNSFYAEIKVLAGKDAVSTIYCFEDTDQLAPYLQKIKLDIM